MLGIIELRRRRILRTRVDSIATDRFKESGRGPSVEIKSASTSLHVSLRWSRSSVVSEEVSCFRSYHYRRVSLVVDDDVLFNPGDVDLK